jgi:hypothetical protein
MDINYSATFNVRYYEDPDNCDVFIEIQRHAGDTTKFRHVNIEPMTGIPVDAQHTRTRFTDTMGGPLEHPWVLALTPQQAIAEAMKVCVDRHAAQTQPYPFAPNH